MAAFLRSTGPGLDGFGSYDDAWEWSVRDLDGFWSAAWGFLGVQSSRTPRDVRTRGEFRAGRAPGVPRPALAARAMPGTSTDVPPWATWFPGAELNYAEHALARRFETPSPPALEWSREDGARVAWTIARLADEVARVRSALRRAGVGRGDRVAAYLPNVPEAVAAFLATASLGAIWSSCSPDFGAAAVVDRFQQIEPKVLFAVTSSLYGGRIHDRTPVVAAVRAALPSLKATVIVEPFPAAGSGAPSSRALDATSWSSFLDSGRDELLVFEPVPFDHPLWILYSSGTTGLPKAIVQGHGGILLEHLKALRLHCDLGEGDRFFWFTTTGWMMWNFLVSGLLVGATVQLWDGSPSWWEGSPDLGALWRHAGESRTTYFGTSAPYLLACRKAELLPREIARLDALRSVGSTGAPLPAEGFGWVYDSVKTDVLLGSISGGTDACTAFVLSNPLLPVHAGEIQCRGLGAKVEAFDASGRPVIDEVGELVLTEPLPSMPIALWNDPDGARYRESWFSAWPGVWRHGDWIRITPRGSCVISGRSDSTLNRGGVRMGTSEFYRVVEALPEIADSLVVDTGSLETAGSDLLWLFVVPRDGVPWDDELVARLRTEIRTKLSPRHVPDEIRAVPEIPRTLNGKKLEVPVKRLLLGVPLERAADPDALANPRALDPFVDLARERTARP